MKGRTIPPPPLSYRLAESIFWPVMKLLGMTCRDAFRLTSTQMDMPLSRPDRIRLRMHLLLCRLCRKLPAQLARQREWLRCCHHNEPLPASHGPALPDETRARIHQHLQQQNP